MWMWRDFGFLILDEVEIFGILRRSLRKIASSEDT
jgi:hypothetical protein